MRLLSGRRQNFVGRRRNPRRNHPGLDVRRAIPLPGAVESELLTRLLKRLAPRRIQEFANRLQFRRARMPTRDMAVCIQDGYPRF